MPPLDQKQIRRDVVRIAWPAILENLLQSVLGMITILMVSRLGSAEVARHDARASSHRLVGVAPEAAAEVEHALAGAQAELVVVDGDHRRLAACSSSSSR